MAYFTEQFEAIGVINQVTVAERSVLAPALSIAREEIGALDDACSRFRDDSELACLNRDGRGTASPLLLGAVQAALDAAEATGGLVDPTVGASLRALGYDRDFELVVRRGPRPTVELRPAAGWAGVRVDPATAAVSLPRRCELDLGATAKAFAADRVATRVHAATGAPVLISLGGDIAVAGEPPAEGWPILVTDSSRAAGAAGQVVAVREGGLATSSTTVRRWRAGEIERHHIVDPRTGASAQTCWRTVSVVAPTCLEANTAATAAVVLGADAPRWLTDRGICARLVATDATVRTTGGWPAPASSSQTFPTPFHDSKDTADDAALP